jgi:hypothetical protein
VAKTKNHLQGADEGAKGLAPFLLSIFLLSEGAESFFLPSSNTISMTRLLTSRLIAEIARVYIRRA